jgi:Ca2+-binding RTX toxin-like protein
MRAHTKGKHQIRKRFAIVIGVAAAGVMALGAQTAAQTQAPTPPGQAPPSCFFGTPATIVGTEGSDSLVGTRGPDVFLGLGGNDVLKGKEGNDVICAGNGDDKLYGGPGKDTLLGQRGRDDLNGGKGMDRCEGGTPSQHGGPNRDCLG